MTNNQRQAATEGPTYYQETVEVASVGKRLREMFSVLITEGSLICIDLANIGLVIWLAVMIRTNFLPHIIEDIPKDIPTNFVDQLWWVITLWLFFLVREGLYVRRMPFWSESKRVVQSTLTAFLFTMAIIALTKLSGEMSRTTLVIAFALGIFQLPLGRYLGKNFLSKVGLWNELILILGAGKTGSMIALSFQNDPYIGYKVIGFLDDDPAKKRNGVFINGTNYPVLGGFQDAPKLIAESGIKEVIVAAPGLPGPELVQLSNRLKSYTHSLLVVPDLIGMSVAGGDIDYLSDDQIVAYRTHNNLADPINVLMKDLFDIIVGLMIFVITLPVIVILALVVKFDSPGPAIYTGMRLGKKGKEFKCYKFRTMYLNNDEILNDYFEFNSSARIEWEKYAKLRGDDPRVTRIGKFLRKTSLDEIPQIFNVIKGDMSLVGARPYLYGEKARMGSEAQIILTTKPGMTGLWQVSGRNEIDFEGRVNMETWYICNWSLWLDISLLFRTVGVVLGRKGAY